jgi:hypothetical protein
MKKSIRQLVLIALATPACTIAFAQKKQLQKTDFAVARSGSVAFAPTTIKDVNSDPTKTVNDLITLPNGKKVKLGDYLNTINTIEKNLAAIGFDKKSLKGTNVVAEYKPKVAAATPKLMSSNIKPLAKTATAQRFTIAKLNSNLIIPSKNIGKLILKTTQVTERNQTPAPFEFTVADYDVKLTPSYTMKGKTEALNFASDAERTPENLKTLVKGKNNEYSMNLSVEISSNIPVLGNVTMYTLSGKFEAKSNKDSSLKSNVRLKVIEQVLITENKSLKQDSYSFTQDRDYNINKLIGAADIFMYGINALSPVNFYMTGKVGGSFDVDLSRTGIVGEMGPEVSQAIILESSVLDLVGAGFLANNVLDAGVGGELKLVQGTLQFGGATGIKAENKKIKLLNDFYNSLDIDFLKGRLYTYYTYPVYECNSIFDALNPNCWGVRRVETNLFKKDSPLKLELTLVDDNQNIDLGW